MWAQDDVDDDDVVSDYYEGSKTAGGWSGRGGQRVLYDKNISHTMAVTRCCSWRAETAWRSSEMGDVETAPIITTR